MIKLDEVTTKLTVICMAGVTINLFGTLAAEKLDLNLFGDMIGTIFIAALGGYMPGIAVGFFTNLFSSYINSENIFFSMVSVSVAILTAFLAGKGYYTSLGKVVKTIPATVLLTSFLGSTIEELMSMSNSFDSWKSFEMLWFHFQHNFFNELPDKGLSIFIAFFALQITPSVIKEQFLTLGRMQAPVSVEMRRAINSNNKFISPLRSKMIFQLLFVTIFIASVISVISYSIYHEFAVNERKRIAVGIITMAANEIDPRRVNEFLEYGYQAEGYSDVEHALYKIRDSNSDIKYLYVYKIEEDGCHVVFDLDTAELQASEPGYIEPFDKSFEKYRDDLLAGKPIPPIINNDKYGYLLTIYKPVYDSMGHCTCYAGIDFSMDEINDYGRQFIAKVVATFSGTLILVFVLSLTFVENNIILPVNTMAYCARNFAYDSEAAREKNIEYMRRLNIRTHDEIENLYSAFLKTTKDSMHYFENLKRSKIQLAVMEELAHKDALTGLRNKTAYNELTATLDAEIADGIATFAIIMIDVNFLKKVNDTYGHERGNEYLINAAKLVCDVFGEEHVYRIGGDEFVVVLDGKNLEHCEEKVATLRGLIEKFRADTNLQPWEKVSAAVGVAYYTSGDKTAEEVFKRADSQMYANKLAMKAVRKD